MTQAERVAHFMRRDVLERVHDPGFGFRRSIFKITARHQKVKRECGFGQFAVGVGAKLARITEQARANGPRWIFCDSAAVKARDFLVHLDVSIENFASAWIGFARAARAEWNVVTRHPTNRGEASRRGVELSAVFLLFDDNRILVANFLERFIPLKNAVRHRFAVRGRDVLVEPIRDGLFRLAQHARRGVRVFFLKPPAIDETGLLFALVGIGEIVNVGREVSNTSIGHARTHGLGQLRETVIKTHEQRAHIWQRGRIAWWRRRIRRGGRKRYAI